MICRLVYVSCDRCGVPAGTAEDLREDAASARLRAKQLGFARLATASGSFKDLCPACAKWAGEPR